MDPDLSPHPHRISQGNILSCQSNAAGLQYITCNSISTGSLPLVPPSHAARPSDANDINVSLDLDAVPAMMRDHGAHNGPTHTCSDSGRNAAVRVLPRRVLLVVRRLLLRQLLRVAARDDNYCGCEHQQCRPIISRLSSLAVSLGDDHQQCHGGAAAPANLCEWSHADLCKPANFFKGKDGHL
jgi:hypothetical protein